MIWRGAEGVPTAAYFIPTTLQLERYDETHFGLLGLETIYILDTMRVFDALVNMLLSTFLLLIHLNF